MPPHCNITIIQFLVLSVLTTIIVMSAELAVPLHLDVALLSPVPSPGVPHQPIVSLRFISSVPLQIYRVFRKNLVFFPIYCNPSLAYIALRDLHSSQSKASVQSLLSAGDFLYNQ